MVRERRTKDITWEYCIEVEKVKGKKCILKCKYCENKYHGGVNRMKHHLAQTHEDVAACEKVPDETRDLFVKLLKDNEKKKKIDDGYEVECFDVEEDRGGEGNKKGTIQSYLKAKGTNATKQVTLPAMVKDRDAVIRDICRCIYGESLPFRLVKSPLFIKMMESAINFGKGLKLPSYHETRVTFLKREVDAMSVNLEKYRADWRKYGCTLMSDDWEDRHGRSITNFLVNSPTGTVFLKSLDTSNISHNADNLFEMLDGLVDEIGEKNLVQVVTDSASAYVSAGEKLMGKRKHLFWTPCTAHILNNMLGDIGKLLVHYDTHKKARKITVFIYAHAWVLDLMRKYTGLKELARPGATRFATSYLTLKSIHEKKVQLRAMFASEEWDRSTYSNKVDAILVQRIILGDDWFWSSITFCLKSVLPLVKVLRLVDGDGTPPMGYIYEAMDRAKEAIQENLKNKEQRYMPIWKIIDDRWNKQIHRPLHAAAYFLNPKFQYAENFKADREVMKGFYDTIETMIPDQEIRFKIDRQTDMFRRSEGEFNRSMAVMTRDKKQPALWWESYGTHVPELQSLAIKVLSLTCSSSGCERNWSIFEHVHSKKRNRLEQQRVNALVYIKYNINLEMRNLKRQERGETYDPICLSDMESDDEWITDESPASMSEDVSWLDIQECFNIDEGDPKLKKRRGPRDLRLDRKKKTNVNGKGKEKVVDLEDEEEWEEVEDAENAEVQVLEDDENEDNDDGIDFGDY